MVRGLRNAAPRGGGAPADGSDLVGEPAPGESVASSLEGTVPRFVLTWPRALLVAAGIALLAGGRGAWFLLALLGLVLWAASRTVAAAARGLVLTVRPVDDHVFAGGEARIEVGVRNRSRWPVPLLLVEARLPEGLHGRLRRVVTLGPRGSRTFDFRVAALRRGVFRLGDTRVVISDGLGLFEQVADVPVHGRLVVYPKLPPVPGFARLRRLPTGPRRDPPSPFRDDLPVGVRPYVRGDPLRAVAWKASARRAELVVREFPPVRESATWIFLDLSSDDWDPRERHASVEQAIATAAALLRQECDGHRPVGLAAWARQVETGIHGTAATAAPAWLRLPPRADPGQPLRAFELLAGVRDAPGGEFNLRLRAEARSLAWGARALVLVPRDSPELWQVLGPWAARGHPVTIVCFERRLGCPPGLAGRHVPEAVEVHTRDGLEYR